VANLTIGLGAALILLGAGGYFGTGRQSMTALIPAAFGAVFVVLGLLAQGATRRKHTMHAAAGLAVLGLAGSIGGVIKAFKWLGGTEPARPAAVVSQSIMAVLLIIFLVLCIRSFIAARRQGAL
jgi:hypothetical protein